MKEWLMEYVIIPRKERLGIIALLLLIGMVWLMPYIWKKTHPDAARYTNQLSSVTTPPMPALIKLHVFDPNIISDEEWLVLGMPEKTVHMIRNYLNKGGRFRTPESLLSIYGIDTTIAKKLIPYVQIKNATSSFYTKPPVNLDVSTIDPRFRKPASKSITILDINTADSAEWEALPWIGEKMASRIIKYREAMGGFYAIDQLAGIYGLSDTAFLHFRPYLRIGKKEIRLLNINEENEQVLSRHPYIQYKQAKALVAYRKEHGPFRSQSDLLQLPMFDQQWLDKIGPYLHF